MLSRPKFLLLLLACIAPLVAACGLKGPLYQPDQARDEAVAPASDSAGSTRKKDSPGSAAPGEQTEPPVSPPDPDRPAVPPQGR
jgi:predicted small lipoprotein YifL